MTAKTLKIYVFLKIFLWLFGTRSTTYITYYSSVRRANPCHSFLLLKDFHFKY